MNRNEMMAKAKKIAAEDAGQVYLECKAEGMHEVEAVKRQNECYEAAYNAAMRGFKETEKAIAVVEFSSQVQDIVENRDDMTQSDYQACLEAIIMKAIDYGRKS